MSREIFISHAVKDKTLADAVVDLLQLGLNVSSGSIFCSSLEGLGIPPGVNFVVHIKAQIQSPKAVVVLLTKNYYASQFCLCELGATWAMGHQLFPLLVSPLKFSDVSGVLTGVQVTPINGAEQLSDLRDLLLKVLSISGTSTARWEVKRDKFLKDLSKLLKKLPSPEIISSADHDKVKNDLKGAKGSIAELEMERERLQSMVDQLSCAKDKNEVIAIKKAHQPAAQILENLENALSEKLVDFPKCVSFLMCKELGLGQSVKADTFKDKDFTDEIHDAAGEQLAEVNDEGFCSLNRDHPQIVEAIKAFTDLEAFLESAPNDIFEAFEAEHKKPLSLGNRKYWEWALDKRISKVYA